MSVTPHVRAFLAGLDHAPTWRPEALASSLVAAPGVADWAAVTDALRVGHGAIARFGFNQLLKTLDCGLGLLPDARRKVFLWHPVEEAAQGFRPRKMMHHRHGIFLAQRLKQARGKHLIDLPQRT